MNCNNCHVRKATHSIRRNPKVFLSAMFNKHEAFKNGKHGTLCERCATVEANRFNNAAIREIEDRIAEIREQMGVYTLP